jgi:hypothetical protein
VAGSSETAPRTESKSSSASQRTENDETLKSRNQSLDLSKIELIADSKYGSTDYPDTEYLTSVSSIPGKGAMVCGRILEENPDGEIISDFAIKLDNKGDEIWKKPILAEGGIQLQTTTVTGDDGFVFGGYQSKDGGNKGIIVHTNEEGNKNWNIEIPEKDAFGNIRDITFNESIFACGEVDYTPIIKNYSTSGDLNWETEFEEKDYRFFTSSSINNCMMLYGVD